SGSATVSPPRPPGFAAHLCLLRSSGSGDSSTIRHMDAVRMVEEWPVPHVGTAVVDADGTVLGSHGDQERVFPLASVTKLLTAYAVLVAVGEEAITLDDPAGPDGSTVRHLLAHASGLDFSGNRVRAQPGER